MRRGTASQPVLTSYKLLEIERTSFVERLNLNIRQQVAAVGRRVSPLCKGEDGFGQQLSLSHGYDNCCLPHASVR